MTLHLSSSTFAVHRALGAAAILTALATTAPTAAAIDTTDTRMLSQRALSARQLAFIYAGDLYVSELDGRSVRRLKGVAELLPYGKGVSAKTHDFDAQGNETHTDYEKMLDLVIASQYRGFIGIEYEGTTLAEPEGIKATKALLERHLQGYL